MGVSEEEVKKISKLCKLSFQDDELINITDRINKVVVDAERIRTITHKLIIPTDITKTVMRSDKEQNSLTLEEALANANNRKSNLFSVPPVMK